MTDRVISIRLKMEIDQARRASQQFAGTLRKVGDDAVHAADTSSKALSSIGAAAAGAGKAAAAIAAATAGGMAVLTASVVKGGVAYNTLEQTSRAALTTVLGSASAASGQMEKLREFAKTSPFPRQVWIQAQQTLLAFGMSAERIVPTFQAIQDAVAASGGNAQTISEITQILARIQSTGKVTAEELNELGYRGIDAAKLVGEAMGKTAGEVRADITSQAISGQQFLDTLTVAMSQHFAGAAAGVKETWTGATDRVKGAIRDIGGLLASPLVDPNGGGAAVEWANGVADALRALEARLGPAVAALRGRAEPAVQALNEKLEQLAEWIRTADFSQIADELRPMLPAIVGVTAGITALGAQSLSSIPIIGNLVGTLKPLPVAIGAAALASPELRSALFDLIAAVAPLLQTVAQLSATLSSALGPALAVVAAILQPVIAVVGFLADRFADLPGVVQMVVAGFVAWKALGLSSMFTSLTGALAAFNEQMKVQTALAAMSGQQIGTVGAAYSVVATKVSTATAGISGAMTSAASFMAGPWGAAIGIAATALGVLTAAQEETKAATEEFTIAVDESTGALTGASVESIYRWAAGADAVTDNGAKVRDVLKDMGITANDLTGYLIGNAEATARVEAALRGVDSEANRNYYGIWLKDLRGQIRDRTSAERDAASAADRYSGSTRDAADATNMAATATGGLTAGLSGVGAASDSAATRTQQLKAALDAIYSSQFALTEAQDGFQSSLHKISGAFDGNQKAATKSADTAEKAAKRSADAAEKYAESLERQQKIIKDTQKQLRELAESQREAEREAAEAAKAARQRQLDALFGQTFDRQSTVDAFTAGLKDAAEAIADAKKEKVAGAQSLTGTTEGALANRDRMRQLTQQAQAVLQAEKDAGASPARLRQVSKQLSTQLTQQAAAWGLNATEVKQYTDAIAAFGQLASSKVIVDLRAVRKEFAEQRQEIAENKREQIEAAKKSAETSQEAVAQSVATAAATKIHTAALKGNSESAIENRSMMQAAVKAAQDELTQMSLNGAGKEALTKRGQELAAQLEREAIKMGFAKRDMDIYTDAIRDSATVVAQYPQLNVRAQTAGALTTIANFVTGVNRQLDKIQKKIKIGALTGSEYVNSIGGGRHYAADGGYISGPGGPREDKIPAMLSNGEFVINARDTARNRGLLEVINRGGDVTRAGFAKGGYVAPTVVEVQKPTKAGLKIFGDAILGGMSSQLAMTGPLGWAASQAGKPYIWASVGPAGYDCSGFMSAITNVIQRKPPHVRRFATGNFPTGDFAKGAGNFMIGSRRGNPGHMAGTLMGVNVESRGGDGVVVGPSARGARDSLFGGNIWHLKGYRDGGMVSGDPPFDLLSPMGKYFGEMVKGSYERGTSHVPMDGLYRLHRGEAVVPRDLNRALVDALRSGKLGGTHNENHIEVKAYSDRFSTQQVMDDLAARGVA